MKYVMQIILECVAFDYLFVNEIYNDNHDIIVGEHIYNNHVMLIQFHLDLWIIQMKKEFMIKNLLLVPADVSSWIKLKINWIIWIASVRIRIRPDINSLVNLQKKNHFFKK